MRSPVGEAYAFGDFEVDLAARALTNSGSPVPLAPKTFDLLALMVRRPGTLLSKREIIGELWPDTFVEEANLSFQVATLRKALGEDASRWIETVPKHGYRFKAPVERLTNGSPNDAPLLCESVGSRGQELGVKRSHWPRVLVAAVVAMALLMAAWLIVRHGRHSSPALLIALPLSVYHGFDADPSLSPDGSQVAFVWDGPSQVNLDIYVKAIGEKPPLRLTSDPKPEFSPAWSPDGRHIAFCREGEVVVVPALGGSERVLVRASPDWVPDHLGGCVSWFPDGSALAVVGHTSPGVGHNGFGYPIGTCAIHGVSLTNGDSWLLTYPAAGTLGDGGPKISPDGRQLAFLRSKTVDFDQPQLFSVPLTSNKLPSGEPVHLGTDFIFGTASEWIGNGLAWLPDSRSVVFAQRGRLWSVPVASGTPKLLPLSGFHPSSLSISRTGRLVFVNESFDQDILRVPGPTNRDVSSKNRPPVAFITSTSPDSNPNYSPDGKRLAFTSMRGGGLQIFVSNSDGSNPAQLTHFAVNTGSPRWSPDGRYIAFDSDEAGQGDIYIIPAEGGPARRFTPDDSYEELPSWSRDGRWIYFGSDRAGQFQLWKAPFPSGKPVQVTQDWGKDAFESPDGKFVYYAKEVHPGIWRQPVAGGREQSVVAHGELFFWGMYNHGLCLLNRESHPPQVECLGFTSRALSTVITLPDDKRIWRTGPSFAVSPDGEWILYSHLESANDTLMSVDNISELNPF